MRYPFFGISPDQYDVGEQPAIAMNAAGAVVEIHKTQGPVGWLYWWVGQVDGTTLRWTGHDTNKYDEGFNPSVALTNDNVVLEVHDSGGVLNTWYRTGKLVGNKIDWSVGEHKKYDGGRDPTVAVNRNGVVVEVHNREVGSPMYWSLGSLSGTKLSWKTQGKKYTEGYNPSVAINSSGLVVEVHDYDNKLHYWIGQVSGDKINWLGNGQYDSGVCPSVTLTDDGYVFEVHQSQGIPPLISGKTVWQRVGRVNGGRIDWIDIFGNGQLSNYYDDGFVPQIASNGKQAVQVHTSEVIWTMHANASLVIDRASWMQDHLNILGTKTLRDIAFPASHDAGMYLGGFDFAILGKTQDLNIYGQLADGVRYFDLRPQYKTDGTIVLHHGSGVLNVEGAKLSDVLDQIARFMNAGHRELAVLKFSHYEDFSQDAFTKMCDLITQKIGTWLYAGPPAGKRLADVPLNDYLAARGTALVVCDSNGTTQYQPPAGSKGFYVYRDWYADHPEQGNLTVFDIYSNTMDFDTMAFSKDPDKEFPSVPRGQLPKFEVFNGKCQKNANVPCDLFLLSWTLTPPTAVWTVARLADKRLVDVVGPVGRNASGRVINALYLDYVEYARGTDLALVRNGLA
jgi:hypothetical protein